MHESKTNTAGIVPQQLKWSIEFGLSPCRPDFVRCHSPGQGVQEWIPIEIEPTLLSLYPSIFCISSKHLVSGIDLNIIDVILKWKFSSSNFSFCQASMRWVGQISLATTSFQHDFQIKWMGLLDNEWVWIPLDSLKKLFICHHLKQLAHSFTIHLDSSPSLTTPTSKWKACRILKLQVSDSLSR